MDPDSTAQELAEREKQTLDNERLELLQQLEDWLDTPMVILGFVWLALLVIDFIHGLPPLLEGLSTAIWAIFVVDFLLVFTLAPNKLVYLKNNWLTALALLLPALRVFRIVRVLRLFRAARAARGLRLLRLVSSLNRGMRALRATMVRRGFGYVLALTVVITLAGSAGMYTFERDTSGSGLKSYGAALWWTAMIMTTFGSDHWPQTAEGRLLCLVLALYAATVFGYLTAMLATFFIGRDAAHQDTDIAGAASVEALRREIAALREEIRVLSPHHQAVPPGTDLDI